MTGPLYNAPEIGLGFEGEDLAMIGKIILLWGQAEWSIGNSLMFALKAHGDALYEHIQSLGFSKKVDLLSANLPKEGKLRALVADLLHARTAFRTERDTLAHGMTLRGPDGYLEVSALAKPRSVSSVNLPRAERRAHYAAVIAMELNFRLTSDAAIWQFRTPPRPD